MRFARRLLRAGAWALSWSLIDLVIFAAWYPLSRGSRHEPELRVFLASWTAIALLGMALLWRTRRPRPAWVLAATLAFAAFVGSVAVFCAPEPSRATEPIELRAPPSPDQPEWRQRIRNLRLRYA